MTRALREIGDALQTCEQSGDDFALAQARQSMGFALIHHDTADSDRGVALLEQVRDQILQGRYQPGGAAAVQLVHRP